MMKIILIFFFIGFQCFSDAENLRAATHQGWRFEVLFTDNSFGSVFTLFGHSALLAIPPGKNITEASVWSLSPNLNPSELESTKEELNAAYGLTFGKYPFSVSKEQAMIYFSDKLVYEFRNIKRIIVPTNSEQSANLIKLLNDLKIDPKFLGNYYFRNENCMTAILKVLNKAGISINIKQLSFQAKHLVVSPSSFSSILSHLLINPYPVLINRNISDQVYDLSKKYEIELTSKLENGQFVDWTSEEKIKISKFDRYELSVLEKTLSFRDDLRRSFIKNVAVNAKPSSRKIVEYTDFPSSFYNVCEDPNCAEKVVDDIVLFYGSARARKIRNYMKMEINRTRDLYINEFDVLNTPQAHSWKFILNALSNRILRN